ncbi:uncharacterized protein LOC121833817 [Ixodes scapularis]|uniref:uncharacterized protein LOC121833817 n=1 Tax=Ixodes scapularis TaxID=6945 RepID=UPI001C383982|nr:uncharacterized protein LOC121833817 [Ixodes scapularis]
MPVIYCPLCPFYDVKFVRVVNHVGQVHASAHNFKVTCGLDNCVKVFSCFQTYRRHLYRNHNMLDTEFSSDDAAQSTPSASASATNFDEGTEPITQPCDSAKLEKETRPFLEVKRTLLLFHLKMTEGLKLPYSTADTIFGMVKLLLSATLKEFAEEVNKKLATLKADLPCSDINTLLQTEGLVDVLFSGMQTKHQRTNLVKKSLPYTEAREIQLQQGGAPKRSFQYVPIQDVLQNLLTCDDIYESVEQPPSQREDGMLNDFSDANFIREQQKKVQLAGDQQSTIFLLLYTDELELNNPLGSAVGKHKILLVYFSILNIHPRHRSKLSSIHLLIIARYSTVTDFGLKVLLEPLIKDLNILRTHGFRMHNKAFKVCVVAVVGDNLSLHRLAGLTCSFSGGRVSRFCLAKYEDLRDLVLPTQCVARSGASHASHLAAFLLDPARNGKIYGITGPSPLASLEGFDIMNQLPPDAMHDVLEGGIAVVVKAVLKGLVDSKVIKKDDLNRIAQFSYGQHDKKSKPVFDPDKFLAPSGNLKGTASQKLCLFRLLPQILGDLIPQNDSNWNVYTAYRHIVDIILSDTMPRDCAAYLEVKVSEFLRLFTEQYPDKSVTPKLHYLLHYPKYILEFGPPRRYWGMRFEAKHSYFKGLASKVKNHKNICKTLCQRHQLLQAYQISSATLSQPIDVSGVAVVKTASLPEEFVVLLPQGLRELDSLSSVKTAAFNNCSYRVGDAFVHSVDDGNPSFAEVHGLFVASGTLIIMAKKLATVEVSKHRCSYIVLRRDDAMCVIPNFQFDYYPLDLYPYGSFLEVVPHYEIFV